MEGVDSSLFSRFGPSITDKGFTDQSIGTTGLGEFEGLSDDISSPIHSVGAISDNEEVPEPEGPPPGIFVVSEIPGWDVSEEQNIANLEVTLSESSNISLLSHPAFIVSKDAEESDLAISATDRYNNTHEKYLAQEGITTKGIQTLARHPKTKAVQGKLFMTMNAAVSASESAIYDAFKAHEDEESEITAGATRQSGSTASETASVAEESPSEVGTEVNPDDTDGESIDDGATVITAISSVISDTGTVQTMIDAGADSIMLGGASSIATQGMMGAAAGAPLDPIAVARQAAKRYDEFVNDKAGLEVLQLTEAIVSQNTHYDRLTSFLGVEADETELNVERRFEKAKKASAALSLLGEESGLLLQKKKKQEEEKKDGEVIPDDDGFNVELESLWEYDAGLKMPVTTMAWCPQSDGLVAIGYGIITGVGQEDEQEPIRRHTTRNSGDGEDVVVKETTYNGAIAIFSPKQPRAPHGLIYLPHAVTTLSFNPDHSGIMAVGCLDGALFLLSVQDIMKNPDDKSPNYLLEATYNTKKHVGAVWQCAWIRENVSQGAILQSKNGRILSQQKSTQDADLLISAAADGHVVQRSLKKSFEATTLMVLESNVEHPQAARAPGMKSILVFRASPVISLECHPTDSVVYLIGTEEGAIFKCSRSYTEQTLQTFHIHTGAVYDIKFSPFNPNIVASVSDDGKTLLWHTEVYQSHTGQSSSRDNAQMDEDGKRKTGSDGIVSLNCGGESLTGVTWVSKAPTGLVVVSAQGVLRVFDFEKSAIEPVCETKVANSLTSVLCSPDTQVVHVGCTDGIVRIYRLNGLEPPVSAVEEDSMDISLSGASRISQKKITAEMLETPDGRDLAAQKLEACLFSF